MAQARRPEGTLTRGTTAPNRLRRVDRWIACVYGPLLRRHERPLVVDLGYGASPVTTAELFTRLRAVHPRVEVVGIEIDPARVAAARAHRREGLFPARRLRAARRPAAGADPRVQRAAPVRGGRGVGGLGRLCARLAPDGVLVEGTCGEIGRRGCGGARAGAAGGGRPVPPITFAAHLPSLPRPSAAGRTAAEDPDPPQRAGRAGARELLTAFDQAWADGRATVGVRAPSSAGSARWSCWPASIRSTPRRRWAAGLAERLGEVTLPW